MHAAVPYSSQQAGGAQSRTIPYRSRRFGIGSSLGYASFEWLGSTWCLRGWSQQPPGITPMPATQPLSKRPLSQFPLTRRTSCRPLPMGEVKQKTRRDLVASRAVDHGLKLDIFLAVGVAAERVHFLKVIFGLEPVALFHLPHAVIGPGAHMVGIGG